MKRDTRARALQIFRSAIHLDLTSRERFLQGECSDDRELWQEVNRLLEADSNPVSFLERGAGLSPGEASRMFEDVEPTPTSDAIVGYELLGVIDSGGMGTVYEAWQRQPRRKVAIKLLRNPLGSEAALARFRFEAEVLGRLQHPSIAQVFESGMFGESRSASPYIAMEFIEGARNLVAYAEDEQLDRDARLRLFMDVCSAIQHGHDRGVLHRDLKPQNLLVDETGRLAVIDFGLARAVDSSIGDPLATRSGQLIGTLQFMSPEQLQASGDLDVRCDVYALGLVLFELLSGRFPWDLEGETIASVARTIAERAPRRLSSVAPSYRGDLEWIIDRAIARDREERYASVADLRADIENVLLRRPVSAGPPSLAYRASKFVRRHTIGVVAASAVLAALGIGTGVALRQRNLALERLAEKNVQLEYSAEASKFMTTILSGLDPEFAQGTEPTVREVMERAVVDLEFDPPEHPLVDALVRSSIGETLLYIGRQEEALALFQTAAATLSREVGNFDERTIHARRAELQIQVLEGDSGPALQALGELRASVARELGEEHRSSIDTSLAYAEALQWGGRTAEGLEQAKKTSELADLALGRKDPLAVEALEVLVELNMRDQRGPEALSRMQDLVSRSSKREELHPTQIAMDARNARLMCDLGDAEAGVLLMGDTARRTAVVFGEGSTRARFIRAGVGAELARQGNVDAAREWLEPLRDALLVPETELGPNDGSVLLETAIGFLSMTDLDGAQPLLDLLVTLETESSLEPTIGSLRARFYLANAVAMGGDTALALQQTEALARDCESVLATDAPLLLTCRNNMVVLMARLGQLRECVEVLPGLIEEMEARAESPRDQALLHTRGNLANMLCALGDSSAAAEMFEELHRLQSEKEPADHDSVIDLSLKLALTAGVAGDVQKGAAIADEAIRLQRERGGGVSMRTLAREREYASVLLAAGRLDDVAAGLEIIRQGSLELGNDLIDVDLHQLGQLENARGNWGAAALALDKAIQMAEKSGTVLERDIEIMRADRQLSKLGEDASHADADSKFRQVLERLENELGPTCAAIVRLKRARKQVEDLKRKTR